jgi:hypothetical protein
VRKTLLRWYQLPEGLEPDEEVEIVAFDHGYYDVIKRDASGQRKFHIFQVNVVGHCVAQYNPSAGRGG